MNFANLVKLGKNIAIGMITTGTILEIVILEVTIPEDHVVIVRDHVVGVTITTDQHLGAPTEEEIMIHISHVVAVKIAVAVGTAAVVALEDVVVIEIVVVTIEEMTTTYIKAAEVVVGATAGMEVTVDGVMVIIVNLQHAAIGVAVVAEAVAVATEVAGVAVIVAAMKGAVVEIEVAVGAVVTMDAVAVEEKARF